MSKPSPGTGKVSIARRRKARSLLVQALYQWQMAEASVNDIEAQFRAAHQGEKVDWEFFHEVLAGVRDRREDLDALFSPFLDRPVADLNPVELALLRMGSFELSQRVDVPYRVVINECVELAKKFGASESHKYINGVLDKTARGLRSAELGGRPGQE